MAERKQPVKAAKPPRKRTPPKTPRLSRAARDDEKVHAHTEAVNLPRRVQIASDAARREPPKLRLINVAATDSYAKDALDYAGKVSAGKILVGEAAQMACQRFLSEYREAGRRGSGAWEFRADLANKAMDLVGRLPNIKGPLAGKPIQLMDWQKFVYANVFGFVERGTTVRRFRQAAVFVPKGNGKTTISAPAALHVCFNENEGGAEGYAAATTRDQARILFDMARQMVIRSPYMQDKLGVGCYRDQIVQPYTASSMIPISSDAKGLDGLNVAIGVCDEIGSHKTSEVYDALISAMGKRLQPLLISISTATGNASGIGRQLWDYLMRVLLGNQVDDRLFGIVYTIDEKDDPWEERSWIKANPGWGTTVQPDAVRAIMRQARNNPAQEGIARTRHLNMWIGADEQLFSMRAFAACHDPELRIEDFEGRDCFVGLDLASRTDLAAIALVFPEPDGRYAVFARCYLNEQAVLEARNPSYPGWALKDWLIITLGNETDFGRIEADVLELCGRFRVLSVAYDPWAALQMSQRLVAKNVPMMELRPTVQNFSAPTKELDAAMRSGRLRHDGNEVLTWCIGNCVGHYDTNDNVKPNKERPENKIDAAIALIMAIARATTYVDTTSVYESRGLLMLG
jgi:phage terminase large subunit-like protein